MVIFVQQKLKFKQNYFLNLISLVKKTLYYNQRNQCKAKQVYRYDTLKIKLENVSNKNETILLVK